MSTDTSRHRYFEALFLHWWYKYVHLCGFLRWFMPHFIHQLPFTVYQHYRVGQKVVCQFNLWKTDNLECLFKNSKVKETWLINNRPVMYLFWIQFLTSLVICSFRNFEFEFLNFLRYRCRIEGFRPSYFFRSRLECSPKFFKRLAYLWDWKKCWFVRHSVLKTWASIFNYRFLHLPEFIGRERWHV